LNIIADYPVKMLTYLAAISVIKKKLEPEGLQNLAISIEFPLIKVISDMEIAV